MKRFARLLFFAGCFVDPASAQDGEHLQVGVFADYLRLSQTDNNFGGVGARVGFQVFKGIKLEGEMSYDFGQAFTEGFTDTGTDSVAFFARACASCTANSGPGSISDNTSFNRL
jgi:hypothetical protein